MAENRTEGKQFVFGKERHQVELFSASMGAVDYINCSKNGFLFPEDGAESCHEGIGRTTIECWEGSVLSEMQPWVFCVEKAREQCFLPRQAPHGAMLCQHGCCCIHQQLQEWLPDSRTEC